MFSKQTINDIDINGKRVLLRVDFNVPIDADGRITDDYRLTQALPTIKTLLERGCSLVLISHLGRPTAPNQPGTSLRPVAARLSQLLETEVQFSVDCIGDATKVLCQHLQPGQVVLLENLRYHSQEEANDQDFAKQLLEASGAQVFVQDAFGVVHRAHASTDAIAKQGIPAVAGLLLEKEITTISAAMQQPERPLMVIIGGVKISDKIALLERFIETADMVAVTGAMANTFLKAEGIAVGASVVEDAELDTAKDLIDKAHQQATGRSFTFFVPRDVVVAAQMDNQAPTRVVDLSWHAWADINAYPKTPAAEASQVAANELILDIGPASAAYIAGASKLARTVIWNGTCGVTEVKGLSGAADPFSHATGIVVGGLVGEVAGEKNHPFVVVGGGDTVAYVESVSGLRDRLGHVSTGGGSSLELMAGKQLPGVEVLNSKEGQS